MADVCAGVAALLSDRYARSGHLGGHFENRHLGSLASPRNKLIHGLENGLFASLNLDRQVEICEILLELGTQTADMVRIACLTVRNERSDIAL